MIGKTISHYKIIEKIGRGGMGVVYKAEDTKLKRTVALKFLSPQLSSDSEPKERFINEAQAASALDHPNICTIYEIGEIQPAPGEQGDGESYIAMAYYDGMSLRDRISGVDTVGVKHSEQELTKKTTDRAGNASPLHLPKPIPIDESINIIIQIASGLARAHEEGIVHRDIKPANIIITKRGEVKILDFGLAKLAGQAQITKDTSTLGTVAYMSPEQAKGEKVDHRTDIWSLGVIMYEMLCSERPFQGEYEQAVIYSILNDNPTPVADHRPYLPLELQKIVEKTISKSADDRYQSAEEIVNDLGQIDTSEKDSKRPSASLRTKKVLPRKRLWRILVFTLAAVIVAGFIYVQVISPSLDTEPTRTDPTVEKVQNDIVHSIVVLPFKDISPAGDNQYFSDGLTEEIITDLSRIRSLRVISRTSAMSLRGTDMDIRTIGEKLNVRYVLEGSVRKAGNELKITAQLIDAVEDAHIWVEEYDGTMDDVFDIQEKVSRSIVEALKIELNPSESQMIADRPLDNSRAYELYLRALEKITHMSEESLDFALEDLNHGLDIVGENALIYSAMGYAYWQYINIGAKTYDEFSGKVEACVEKIFELEPESPHGYMLLVRLLLFIGDTKGQIKYLLKVLEKDPNNSDALAWLAVAYIAYAKMDEAWRIQDILEKNDPLRPRLLLEKSYIYWIDGSFDLAMRTIEEYKLHQSIMGARFFHSLLLVYHHRLEDASLSAAMLEKEAPGSFFSQQIQFIIHAYKGENKQAKQLITPDYITATKKDYQYSLVAALGYTLLKEKDKALYWLENAVNLGFYNYIYLSEHDPILKNLRGEERFQKLIKYAKAQCDEFEVLE